MSIVQLFPDEGVLFGRQVPADINVYLQRAVQAYDDTAEAEQLLWAAHRLNPEQLEVYIALYKFYFYKYRLLDAERVCRLALTTCARLGGFAADWRELDISSADWQVSEGPERVYLYSLKALGFIRLRRLDFNEGQQILEKLRELDVQDQVGGSVLLDVAAGMREVLHG